MTPEDYKFVTTLVLTSIGAHAAFMTFLIGFLYMSLNKRLELIEKRLDRLENGKLLKS